MIRPTGDRVLVKRKESQAKVGSLFIPDAAKEKAQRAEVVAVGPGKWGTHGERLPMSVEAGDTVLLSKWPGGEVKVDGEEVLLVEESEILGVEE